MVSYLAPPGAMTDEKTDPRSPHRLAWILAAAFLVLYLATLNWWVTWESLPVVAKATGWDWSPQTENPLLFLLLLPFRLLPVGAIPVALNALSALLASMALYQLARSVALIPQEPPREGRRREGGFESVLKEAGTAWIPPVTACLACGLQLTFWESATSMTGDMLSLLLFSVVIRCLLEFRIRRDNRLLFRMALIYGIGLPTDWAFYGFLPLLLASLVWIKGLPAFRPAFLLRMAGWGSIGLALYLLLPLAILIQGQADWSAFLELVKLQIGNQKNLLLSYPRSVVILSLVPILPVLVMGIRFPQSMGEMGNMGQSLVTFMIRAMHLLFLGICVWVAFDPLVSPRHISHERQLPGSFITFYYLIALAIGHYSGYALAVFGRTPARPPLRPSRRRLRLPPRLAACAMAILAASAALGLIYRNLPQIRWSNGAAIASFGKMLLQEMPQERALVLSDHPDLELFARSSMAQLGKEQPHAFVITALMGNASYRQHLLQEITGSFPELAGRMPDPLNIQTLREVLSALDQEGIPLCYLNYSFGYYFELFDREQRGLVTRLVRHDSGGGDDPPSLGQERIGANLQFWEEMGSGLWPEAPAEIRRNRTGLRLSTWISRELNHWGVILQREGRTEEAGEAFEGALEWNPVNLSAELNQRQNRLLRGEEGKPSEMTGSESTVFRKQYLGSIDRLLQIHGPADTAQINALLADALSGNNPMRSPRQAARHYHRAFQLDPASGIQSLKRSVEENLVAGLPELVLEQIGLIRQPDPDRRLDLDPALETDLAIWEARALFDIAGRQESPSFGKAQDVLESALERDPGNLRLKMNLHNLHLILGNNQEAMSILEELLAGDPGNPALLLSKAVVLIQMDLFDEAVEVTGSLLEEDPGNLQALLNQAIAHRKGGRLEEARKDYLKADGIQSGLPLVLFGLGQIEEEAGNAEEAIGYYQRFLDRAAPGTKEYQMVEESLQSLASPGE